jgi:hypothetical protein
MRRKCLLVSVGVGVAFLLAQPSPAWAQAGANLVITLSHRGNFTLGEHGVYTIVVSNVGGTASVGQIEAGMFFPNLPNTTIFDYESATGNGWSCSMGGGIPTDWLQVTCDSTSVIAPGGSATPLALTVTPFVVTGTVTNTATVSWGTCCPFLTNSASDPTIVVAAVPTLPQWAMMALTVLLVLIGVAALRRRTT